VSKSAVRSIIITGGAVVGITASVTTGAAGAWSDGSDSGFPQADAANSSNTQPQNSNSNVAIPSASAATPLNNQGEGSDDSAPATQTKKSSTKKVTTKVTTTKKKTTTTKKKTTTPAATTPATTTTDGTFTGAAASAGFYGTVQVQVVVSSGHVTNVNVLQAPSGRNSRYTNYALPILTQETLDAQSANISTASGASFTSRAFIKSLQSALSKAGM
jgi:uncharacterized protein with FMN-binding domain